MMHPRLLVVLLAACLAGPAGAQAPHPQWGTVTGQSYVDLKKPPEVLRVQIEILAKGKDLKEALARLKERREAIKSRLAALGAIKDAVVFGEPALGGEKTEQQKQLAILVEQRLRAGGGKPAAKSKSEPPAVVSTWLRFEVPLKAANPEDLLLVAQGLQDKILAADLGGTKELQKLSPQEEEIAEENQIAQMMGQEGAPKRGEPAFSFVSKITDEDLARAQAEAFQKARQEAMKLARAAGAELGPLQHLESQNAGASGEEAMIYYRQQRFQAPVPQGLPGITGPEAVGAQPGQITYRVAVTAAFLLKGPPG
jgi:uncharacterized protein YggE